MITYEDMQKIKQFERLIKETGIKFRKSISGNEIILYYDENRIISYKSENIEELITYLTSVSQMQRIATNNK